MGEYTLDKAKLAGIVETYGLMLNIESGAYEAPFSAFAAWYHLLGEDKQRLSCEVLMDRFDADIKKFANEEGYL